LKQEITGVKETGKAVVAEIEKRLGDTELELIMTQAEVKRARGRPKKNMSMKNRGRKAVYKADAQVEAQAQVSTKMNRPLAPAISSVGEGIATIGEGIISAEGKQGGGGVAPDVIMSPRTGKPVRQYIRKPKQEAMTANFQNASMAQEQPVLTDVLQQGGVDMGQE
jgi:hypothetical protein